tara:strand:- start:57 stop:401 length:345 start_codon:yes stop_codon:yes gene_type:complete
MPMPLKKMITNKLIKNNITNKSNFPLLKTLLALCIAICINKIINEKIKINSWIINLPIGDFIPIAEQIIATTNNPWILRKYFERNTKGRIKRIEFKPVIIAITGTIIATRSAKK